MWSEEGVWSEGVCGQNGGVKSEGDVWSEGVWVSGQSIHTPSDQVGTYPEIVPLSALIASNAMN